MSLDIIATIIGALASLLAGGLASSKIIQKFIQTFFHIEAPQKPYSERLGELTSNLTKASREVDSILGELAQVARSRESAVVKLESDLSSLEAREKELKDKIEVLQKVPIPVAEHFARLLESGEKRSARRDYALFGAGVLVTTFIAIAIQLFTGR